MNLCHAGRDNLQQGLYNGKEIIHRLGSNGVTTLNGLFDQISCFLCSKPLRQRRAGVPALPCEGVLGVCLVFEGYQLLRSCLERLKDESQRNLQMEVLIQRIVLLMSECSLRHSFGNEPADRTFERWMRSS